MGYCFMTTQKVKTLGQLSAKYNHNYRQIEVSNADPSLIDANETLISTLDKKGNIKNYADAWNDRIQSIPYYNDHGIRSNAVLAIEVITTFSRDENIDLEAWKKENVEWLNKTFNVAGDGKNNVIDVIYHADEPGNVHCHAIIVPIDERNRLNASRFLDGQRALTGLQNDYAKSMKQFGLERGLENGQAKHKDIKKYYADLNNAIKVPYPEKNESAIDYRDRVLEEIQTLQASAMREREEKRRQMERKLAEKRISHEKHIKSEYDKLNEAKAQIKKEAMDENLELSKRINTQKDIIRENESILSIMKDDKSTIESELFQLQEELNQMGNIKDKIRFYDSFQKQYQIFVEQEPNRAKAFVDELRYMGTLTRDEPIK